MERVKIHPDNPQLRLLRSGLDIMKRSSGIAIYPTDTVYGVGCTVSNTKALKAIAKILHRDEDRLFSFLCSDISQVGEYAELDTPAYKILKKYTPGPFTFILPASKFVKKRISEKRKTVGIRIPDSNVARELIQLLGEPLANMTLNIDGEVRGNPDLFMTPDVINGVDVMFDVGEIEDPNGSTIIDLTGIEPIVIRQGKGEWNE
jgi:tRNA threonylcarbamoyl adenosine modification protein (Sua5/YciO/YrdC/YwlC family)